MLLLSLNDGEDIINNVPSIIPIIEEILWVDFLLKGNILLF